jgi:hypothetical protein
MTGPIRPRGSDAVFALIRISLLLGVLLFGAVTWFVHRNPSWRPQSPDALRPLRVVMLAGWVAAIIALIALRPRLGRLTDDARRTFLVICWAIGEGAALLGAVHYFLSGDPLSFLGGLVVMMAALLLYPIRRE